MSSIRVVHFGLGPIGAAVAKEIAARPGFKIVGGIDTDPAKVGHDLGDVVGLPRRLGVKVSGDPASTLKKARPHVVLLCTSSSMKQVMPQLLSVLKAKVPIVATTEELAYPGYTHVRLARQVHALAKKAKVAVLATGVNPGFVMDALPIALTAVCQRVDRVTVHRIQDARHRRLPFQQKIGAGLTTEQFQKRVDEGSIKHVGFTESIAMIADSLGWTLDRISDHVEPKLAQVTVSSEFLAVDPGYVCGIVQEGIGYRKKEPAIRLRMEAYLGAPDPYDLIEIDGNPRLSVRIAGGVHGDVATAAIVVNSIPKVLDAAPGLHTMRDMPLPSFFAGK
jgi:4-hydroxy-tetrahydrodipicolinate reductase